MQGKHHFKTSFVKYLLFTLPTKHLLYYKLIVFYHSFINNKNNKAIQIRFENNKIIGYLQSSSQLSPKIKKIMENPVESQTDHIICSLNFL
jgi:hypothetical protein